MRTLVIGGARSGKSHAAETMLADTVGVTYVATAYPADHDPEWTARVAAHQARRPVTWSTVETLELADLLAADGGPLLVDCLPLGLPGVSARPGGGDDHTGPAPAEAAGHAEVDALVAALAATTRDVLLVTNEVGQGVVPATASGRRFRDEMGVLNIRVGDVCGEVLWCVAGRTVRL